MGSNFMNQFLIGWRMGQDRIANQRSAEQEAYQRQQDEFKRQQDMEDRALRLENYKIQKQQLDLQMKQEKLAAAEQERAMRERANALQSQLPTPTAAEVGIPEQGPEFGGPMASEVQVPQPMMPMPSPTGGADIPTPILTGRQQQEMAQAEKQRKLLETLGMLRQQEAIKAEFRQPDRPVSVAPGGTLIDPSTGKVIFKAPEKAAAGGEAAPAGGMTYGTAKAESEKKAVDTARFALSKMPEWESYIQSHQDIFGPIAGRVTQFKQSGILPNAVASKLGMSVDPEIAKRQAEFAVMRNNMINSLSGAAVSPAEFERLKQQIPELTDDPVVVQQKLSVLKDYFGQKLQAYNIQSPGAAAPKGEAKAADPLGIR